MEKKKDLKQLYADFKKQLLYLFLIYYIIKLNN